MNGLLLVGKAPFTFFGVSIFEKNEERKMSVLGYRITTKATTIFTHENPCVNGGMLPLRGEPTYHGIKWGLR